MGEYDNSDSWHEQMDLGDFANGDFPNSDWLDPEPSEDNDDDEEEF